MAERLRNLRKYIQGVEEGAVEIEHLWPHYIAKYLRTLIMWFDTEEWVKASIILKVSHVIMFVSVFMIWIFLVMQIVLDWGQVSASKIADAFARLLGGYLLFVSFLVLHYHRDTLTECIRVVDTKFHSVPTHSERGGAWKREIRQVYALEPKILFVCVAMGVLSSGPMMIQAIISGIHAFDTVIPYTDQSYSLGWWLEWTYHTVACTISGVFYASKEFMVIGLFYYCSVLVRVQSQNILELCQEPNFDAAEETKKFCLVFRELQELMETSEKLKRIISFYLINFFLISFLIMSMGGLATIVESKNVGWAQAVATNMIYPVFTMSITFCWAKIGEYYEDSVNSVDEALYLFNWVDAPLGIKKMALIYKIKFVHPNVIKGGQFYVSNLQLFGDIIKKSYYFLTLLMGMI